MAIRVISHDVEELDTNPKNAESVITDDNTIWISAGTMKCNLCSGNLFRPLTSYSWVVLDLNKNDSHKSDQLSYESPTCLVCKESLLLIKEQLEKL